ncbi:kelch-like protein 31 [Parasteatoda tepidariorum]|uniref:kelch-like protein 31 n=1 Tax=Parasteatoda tepidariorum TaxID=114398 RepID=UPI0039BC6F4D
MLIYFSPRKKVSSIKRFYRKEENPNSDTLHLSSHKHFANTVSKTSKSNFQTDIIIKVQDYTFYADKFTLSSCSQVLKMFIEKNETKQVKIKDVKPDVLRIVLHYMYSNKLNANCQNIVDVYSVARKLKMKPLIDQCIQLFLSDNVSAYIYIYAAAWELEMIVEKHIAYKEILKNFEKCAKTEEFMNLSIFQICEILIGLSLDWLESYIKRKCLSRCETVLESNEE